MKKKKKKRNGAWHINPTHTPLNCNDDGLLPETYLYLVRKKMAANYGAYKRTSCRSN